MLVERRHVKKDLVVGLLDIAIFIALMGQIGVNRVPLIEDFISPVDRIEDSGPMLGLAHIPRYPFHVGVDYPSMKSHTVDVDSVMHDYAAIMQDAQSRVPAQNVSGNNSVSIFYRNVTAMMLRAAETYADANDTATAQHDMALEEQEFDIFHGVMPEDIDLDLASNAQEQNNFDNGDDVRWRDYLVAQNSKNNENQHCDDSDKDSNCTSSEPDVHFHLGDMETEEPSNTSRERTTSIFSEESGIEVETSSPAPSLHDHTYSVISPALTPSSGDESFDLDMLFAEQEQPTSSGANARVENDVDLQQMYLQDIDLGYNWQTNEVPKQIKEVDDIFAEKNKNASQESISYFVDGETGEQIPIPQTNNTQSQQQNVSNQPQNNNQTNFFNLEEYFGVFTNTDNQQQSVQTQNASQGLPVMVPDNTSADNNNEGLWADVGIMPGLNTMGMGSNANPMMNNANTLDNMHGISNNPMPNGSNSTMMDHARMEQQQNIYNTTNLNFTQCENFDTQPSNVFKNQTINGYLPGNNTPSPGFQPPARLSPSFGSSPLRSDDGIPMEGTSGGSSPMSNPDMNEQSYLLGQLNNYQVAMETGEPFGNGQRMMSPASEPGQFFFDQPSSSNMNKMLSEIISINSNMSPFDNNVNGSYMNPPQGSFHPPPLDSKPGFVSCNEDPESHMKSRLDSGESYESDSGISVGHSPQRFGVMPQSAMEDALPFGSVSPIKDSLMSDGILNMEEMKAIHHNHTYNGTVGAKAKTKKKVQKAAQPRESRDMRKARELNIPFTLDEIVMSPVEEYNEMLARTPLTQAQQTLIKDIRRRGKNKVAAQNCRKRKIETITHMEDDVDVLRSRKHQLMDEQKDLESTRKNMQMQYNVLYQQIFSSLRDESGRPYDANRFSLEQVDSAVLLVPRVARDDGCRDNGSSRSNAPSSPDSDRSDDARRPKIDFFKVKTEKGE